MSNGIAKEFGFKTKFSPTLPATNHFSDEIYYNLSTEAPAGRANNIAYEYQLREDSNRKFFGWWLWPALTFNIFPGQQNLLVFHMLPLSANKSVGYCDYFFLDGIINEEAQALMDWEGNILEKEDNELIVAAHRGLKSQAFTNGIFIIDDQRHDISEGPLAHFNQLVSRALAAEAGACPAPAEGERNA